MKKGYLTVLWPQITNILDEYNCVNKIARIVGSGFLQVLWFRERPFYSEVNTVQYASFSKACATGMEKRPQFTK